MGAERIRGSGREYRCGRRSDKAGWRCTSRCWEFLSKETRKQAQVAPTRALAQAASDVRLLDVYNSRMGVRAGDASLSRRKQVLLGGQSRWMYLSRPVPRIFLALVCLGHLVIRPGAHHQGAIDVVFEQYHMPRTPALPLPPSTRLSA